MLPRLTKRAIDYAWGELLRRAGVPASASAELGVAFHYVDPSDAPAGVPAIVVRPSDPEDWQRLLELAEDRLESVPKRDAFPIRADGPAAGTLPVLFRARGSPPGSDFARL